MYDCYALKLANTYERVSKLLQRETTNQRNYGRNSQPVFQAIKNPEQSGLFNASQKITY